MDRYTLAPVWAIAHPCNICDEPIRTGDSVAAEYDFASDTGASMQVRHTHCEDAILQAKADAFREAAKIAELCGAPDVAAGLLVRAMLIEPKVPA